MNNKKSELSLPSTQYYIKELPKTKEMKLFSLVTLFRNKATGDQNGLFSLAIGRLRRNFHYTAGVITNH